VALIHYHGTPITPMSELAKMAGAFFCVSYACPQDVVRCHTIGSGVMLDNGAFSVWKRNMEPDWPGYYRFCERWLEHWTTWAVIPDSIDGGVADNDRLLREWPFGHRGAPVWHLHEPLGRLEGLVAEWPLVCLGSSGKFSDPRAPEWRARMRMAMDIACDERGVPLTRLHMLRGLRFSAGPYPFYSADSTNVAQNHKRQTKLGEDVFSLTRRIDSQQPPHRWIDA
jgi:hypothetical protein